MVQLLGVIFFFVALSIYCNYLFVVITIAIWFPQHSKPRWLEFVNSLHFGHFFFKWIGPLLVLIWSANILQGLVRLI